MDLREQIDQALILTASAGYRSDVLDAVMAVVEPAIRSAWDNAQDWHETATLTAQRAEQAEAERDRFAEELAHQIGLHTQRPGHPELDRRGCQTCRTFRELRELPSIVAAQARIHAAIAEALRTGNYAACYLADDGTPLAQPGDQDQP